MRSNSRFEFSRAEAISSVYCNLACSILSLRVFTSAAALSRAAATSLADSNCAFWTASAARWRDSCTSRLIFSICEPALARANRIESASARFDSSICACAFWRASSTSSAYCFFWRAAFSRSKDNSSCNCCRYRWAFSFSRAISLRICSLVAAKSRRKASNSASEPDAAAGVLTAGFPGVAAGFPGVGVSGLAVNKPVSLAPGLV